MKTNKLHRVTVIRTVHLQAEALIEAVDSDDAIGQIQHQLEQGSCPALDAVNWGEVCDGVFEDAMLGEYEIVRAEADE